MPHIPIPRIWRKTRQPAQGLGPGRRLTLIGQVLEGVGQEAAVEAAHALHLQRGAEHGPH